MIRTLSAALSASLLLSGCAVGPDFLKPKGPDVAGYTPEKLSATTSSDVAGGAAQRFIDDRDIPGQWWALFRSEPLNQLIEEALKANPTLGAAQATLRQARENVLAERGVFFPQVNGSFSTTREKISTASFGFAGGSGSIFTVTSGSLSVSYLLDVFGGEQRQFESVIAQAEYQQYQVEAAYLTLTSNVVTAAIQEASLRAQITATQEIIDAQTQELQLLQRQFELGGISWAAVLAQQATLDATRATLPGLEKQLAQQRNQLTALAGRLPSQEISQTFDLASLQLPEELPVSLPSKLVEQRPDIQASQAQLHQASAQVGVAIANMLPQITLSGSYGNTVLDAAKLFSGPGVWSIGASVAQPLFRGGTLLHEKRAAEAAFDAAAAQYRNTVITAFHNVADTLRALQSDASALAAQVAAERSASDSLAIAHSQYEVGAINYATLLNAETTYQQAHVNRVVAQATRYADTAALFQALGGGWWNRTDIAESRNDTSAKQ